MTRSLRHGSSAAGPRAPGRRVAGLLLAALIIVAPAPGAELFYMDHDPLSKEYVGPVGPLVLSGDVAPGDYDQLLARIAADANRFIAQNKLIVGSDGGDVSETLRIANLVKSLDTEVLVGPLTGRCIGTCFLIYAAAARRGTDGAHLVGIHRPNPEPGSEAQVRGFSRKMRFRITWPTKSLRIRKTTCTGSPSPTRRNSAPCRRHSNG